MSHASLEEISPGAHLVVRYAVYRHHGIYAGHGRVIHYAGWIRGRRGLVEETSLDDFAEGRSLYVRKLPPDRASGRAIVRRARSRLGERRYHLIENNCEHFCTWSRSGTARSLQIERMATTLRLVLHATQSLFDFLEWLSNSGRSNQQAESSRGQRSARLVSCSNRSMSSGVSTSTT
jgi:hypothetical protein